MLDGVAGVQLDEPGQGKRHRHPVAEPYAVDGGGFDAPVTGQPDDGDGHDAVLEGDHRVLDCVVQTGIPTVLTPA